MVVMLGCDKRYRVYVARRMVRIGDREVKGSESMYLQDRGVAVGVEGLELGR
jgi:hypothetical protein